MAEGIDKFMQAIGTLESGNRYDAVGPNTGSTYGRARGKYQIMETIWPGWAREAGVPNADWRDPQAQEHVARYKMSQYFKRYGRWDLVAVAWFAGPGRANQAQKQGIQSVGGLSDVIGTSVAQYVDKTMDLMGNAPSPTPVQAEDSFTASARRQQRRSVGIADIGTDEEYETAVEKQRREFVEGRRSSSETMASIMSTISRAASASGGRVLDTRALFGDIFGKDDEPAEEEEVA